MIRHASNRVPYFRPVVVSCSVPFMVVYKVTLNVAVGCMLVPRRVRDASNPEACDKNQKQKWKGSVRWR